MRLNPAQSFLERYMVTLRNVWLNCTLTSKTFSVKYGQSEKLILIAKSWRKLTKKDGKTLTKGCIDLCTDIQRRSNGE